MTLPALASADDLATWLGATFDDTGEARAQAVLDVASTLVRNAANQTWVDEADDLVDPLPGIVKAITLIAASRAWSNPTGAQSTNRTAGPFAEQMTWGADSSVVLTQDEVAQLQQFNPQTQGIAGLSSIRVRNHDAVATAPPLIGDYDQILESDGQINPDDLL